MRATPQRPLGFIQVCQQEPRAGLSSCVSRGCNGLRRRGSHSLNQTLQPGWYVGDPGESCSDSNAALSLLNRKIVPMPSQSLSSVQDSGTLAEAGLYKTGPHSATEGNDWTKWRV